MSSIRCLQFGTDITAPWAGRSEFMDPAAGPVLAICAAGRRWRLACCTTACAPPRARPPDGPIRAAHARGDRLGSALGPHLRRTPRASATRRRPGIVVSNPAENRDRVPSPARDAVGQLLHADTHWDYDDRITRCDVGWLSHRRGGAKRSRRHHGDRSLEHPSPFGGTPICGWPDRSRLGPLGANESRRPAAIACCDRRGRWSPPGVVSEGREQCRGGTTGADQPRRAAAVDDTIHRNSV